MVDAGERRLSDADVDAIAAALEERFTRKFYLDLGKGVWGSVWKAIVFLLCVIAAAGAMKGYGLTR